MRKRNIVQGQKWAQKNGQRVLETSTDLTELKICPNIQSNVLLCCAWQLDIHIVNSIMPGLAGDYCTTFTP